MKIKNNNGFSLIELSVVLLISGILLVASFEGSKYILVQNQIDVTNKKLDMIQQAIDIYARSNGYLPCPAYLGVNSGLAVNDCYNKTSSDSTNGYFQIGNVIVGAVPYKDLNLPANISYDAWGGKFTYTVYQPAAKNLRTLDMRKINTNQYISIYENKKDDDYLITNQAVYSIVSHGRNKYYGYQFKTNKAVPPPSDTTNLLDQKNGPNEDKQTILYFTEDEMADDIVRYKTVTQFIIEADISDLNCCVTNSIIEDLKNKLDISGSIDFTGFTSDCKFLVYNEEYVSIGGTEKYILKCYKYGRLGMLRRND